MSAAESAAAGATSDASHALFMVSLLGCGKFGSRHCSAREIADWAPNPEQQYTQGELKDILSRTIQGLPASFRTVFVLRDVEGLSTEETADALGLSIPAVKSRLLRARLQLRERLNKYFKNRSGGDGKQ